MMKLLDREPLAVLDDGTTIHHPETARALAEWEPVQCRACSLVIRSADPTRARREMKRHEKEAHRGK